MECKSIKKLLTPAISILIILLLVVSFGLHSVQIPHAHPGEAAHHQAASHGDNEKNSNEFSILGEYAHSAEKKLLLLIVSAGFLALSASSFLRRQWSTFILTHECFYRLRLQLQRLFILFVRTHIEWLFSRGILNPKLY
jgi:hypothetical protein